MLGIEENKVIIQEYLDKADNMNMMIFTTPAGVLTPLQEFPESVKQKGNHCNVEP